MSAFIRFVPKKTLPYDLIFTNRINGKAQRRVNVLFPEEESFKFDLSFIDGKPIFPLEDQQAISKDQKKGSLDSVPKTMAEKSAEKRREDARSTFYSFTRQGFVHVLPLGLDHILFVLVSFSYPENGSRFYIKSPYLLLLTPLLLDSPLWN